MRVLSREWWKLSYRWFFHLEARSSAAKKGLFRNSMKVSVIGLSLAVGALGLVKAIVRGFEWELARGVSQSLGHAVYFTHWRSIDEMKQLLAQFPPGVSRADLIWTTQGLLVGPKGGRGVLMEGRHEVTADSVSDAQVNSQDVLIDLGKPLAEYLGVGAGGVVKVLLPGVLKGSVEARVRRLIDNGMHAVDSRLAVIDDKTLRPVIEQRDPESWQKRPGDAHGIRFFMQPTLANPTNEAQLNRWVSESKKKLIESKLDDSAPVLRTWREQRKNLFGAVEHEQGMLSMVFSLLTLVAALNVAATLVVLFLERDRELAILQAVGMPRILFIQWVCIQGLVLGLLSSLLGLLMSRVLGWCLLQMPFAKLPSDIYNISTIPLRFDGKDQLWVFLFGIIAALSVSFLLGLRLSRVRLLTVLGQRR